MARSYLMIEENNFQIYRDPHLLEADALIIDVYDASCIFSNYDKLYDLLTEIKQHGTKLYLKLDPHHLNRCYKALDLTLGHYLSGFYIDHPTIRDLNRFHLKIREYEQKNRLEFGSLSMIVGIKEAKDVIHLNKIVAHPRVETIVINPIPKVNMVYVTEKATQLTTLYKKELLDRSQITMKLADVAKINQAMTPSPAAIGNAMDFLQKVRFARGKERREMLEKDSLSRAYRVLRQAEALGLISELPTIHYIRRRKKEYILKKPLVIKKFYTVGEEIANGITHGVGAGLAIAGLVLLMVKGGTTQAILSYLTFTISAIILYLMSTLYHALALGELAKKIFQKFDHMTIYLLIAGTYTPFSLLAIGGTLGTVICILLWTGCAVGLLLNLFAFGRFRLFHMILYVFLGWIAIFFLPQIIANIGPEGVLFLILGGAMYTIGILFYSFNWFKFSHMVWHVFTLLGSILHFFAIFFYL